MNIITFNKSARKFILDTFGKIVGKEGYVVEKSNPTQRVLTQDGEEIYIEEFGGVRGGSEIYIKSDLMSLIQLCDALSKKSTYE